MITVMANDTITTDARRVTDEGYLIVPGRLARTGIQHYLAKELGLKDRNANDTVRIYRPEDEVFNPSSMKSFDGAAVTIGHPQAGVNAKNWKQLAMGEAREIARDGIYMKGTLVIRDSRAIKEIESGKVELSNGYTFDLDLTPGEADGMAYDGVQRNIRGNHVAIVSAARCGSACRIADSDNDDLEKGDETMADKRKLVVDGIQVEAEDAAASAIEKLLKERDAAIQARDAALATTNKKLAVLGKDYAPEELVKLATDQAAQIELLKKDAMTPEKRDAMVADWATLIADTKALAADVKTEGRTCLEIRRDVISKLGADSRFKSVVDAQLAGRNVEALDADSARIVFNTLKALGAAVTSTSTAAPRVGDQLLGDQAKGKEAGDKKTGRDAFSANLQRGFQQANS